METSRETGTLCRVEGVGASEMPGKRIVPTEIYARLVHGAEYGYVWLEKGMV